MSKANASDGKLLIKYSGRLADTGSLSLVEYTESLMGWRRFFQVAGELYLRSKSDKLKRLSGAELLEIRIVAERPGSYEVIIAFILGQAIGGMIGGRADAALVAICRHLMGWYRRIIKQHIQTKTQTTNVEEIVKALERLCGENGVELESSVDVSKDQFGASYPVISKTMTEEEGDDAPENDRVSKARVLVETVDEALKSATCPLDSSCNKISVIPEGEQPLGVFGQHEREVLQKPLSLPLPEGTWNPATIKFVRINRRTGSALISFENEPTSEKGSHYSRIVDESFRQSGDNVYTQAFNKDVSLKVWVRQIGPRPGRLNFQWEITAKQPTQLHLFGSIGRDDKGQSKRKR